MNIRYLKPLGSRAEMWCNTLESQNLDTRLINMNRANLFKKRKGTMSDHGKSDRNSSDHLITRALRALRKDFRVIISITFIALSVGVIRKDPTTWAITLFILAAALVAVWTKK